MRDRNTPLSASDVARLAWEKMGGLLQAIVQDHAYGRGLMLGYMNEEALARSIETGEAWFWSRSRKALWRKGETSGNVLHFVDLAVDCDGDALLVRHR